MYRFLLSLILAPVFVLAVGCSHDEATVKAKVGPKGSDVPDKVKEHQAPPMRFQLHPKDGSSTSSS